MVRLRDELTYGGVNEQRVLRGDAQCFKVVGRDRANQDLRQRPTNG